MLSIPPNTTIYWHTEPTDMRKGIDGLSGIVRSEFDGDPPSTHLAHRRESVIEARRDCGSDRAQKRPRLRLRTATTTALVQRFSWS